MTDDLTRTVAEAIDNYTVNGYALDRDEKQGIATAVIAALADLGDVTGEQIAALLRSIPELTRNPNNGDHPLRLLPSEIKRLVPAVRDLLAQATAPLHARIAELGAEIGEWKREYPLGRTALDKALARAEAAEAEVAILTEQLEASRDSFSAAHAASKSANNALLVAAENSDRAMTERDALRATVDRVRALTFASDDGREYEHVKDCRGEPTCGACWAESIRVALDGPQPTPPSPFRMGYADEF